MANKLPFPTEPPRQKTFLVGIEYKDRPGLLSLDDSLEELALLADTAGLDVVGSTYQRIDRPDPNTLIGSGKVGELTDLTEETLADVVIFDEELSPRHMRELQGALGDDIQVLDRTALILDIFAQHAHTREGALQVELAQYEYRLPRLTRAWTHLARQAGGGGGRSGGVGGVGLRGPGETQLEVDRREIGRKIAFLKRELEKVRAHRSRYRAQRKRSAVPVVAIVGYTNAGKSTLLNRLADADVFAANQLFATLDPTTRRVSLPSGNTALFTDTVGFIQKLPTQLVAAFRATLDEIRDADMLLHVVDVTHPNAVQQALAVKDTLVEIEASDMPVVTGLNKIDLLPNPAAASQALADFENAMPISGVTGEGIDRLLEKVEAKLFSTLSQVVVRIPYQQGRLISVFHEHGVVEAVEHEEGGVQISGRLPARLEPLFRPYALAKTRRRARRVTRKL